MHHIDSNTRRPATAVLIAVLASFALAACGSSSTSSSSTAASASTSTGGKTSLSARFAQVRECLHSNGITLPGSTPGQSPRPGGGLLGAPLPKGVTRAQYEAALKKCGVQRRGLGAGAGLNNPNRKQALVKFAACMRQHGVKVGEPDTSGKGPVFDTTGINRNSAQFRTAETSCVGQLRVGAPGAGGGGAPGGAPTG
jgi:hypothetical protein